MQNSAKKEFHYSLFAYFNLDFFCLCCEHRKTEDICFQSFTVCSLWAFNLLLFSSVSYQCLQLILSCRTWHHVCLYYDIRSVVKVHTQPRSPKDHACDVVNYLSSVLFPPGISNAPIEQLQQFYGAAVANRMVSANDIEKRNVVDSTGTGNTDGQFVHIMSRTTECLSLVDTSCVVMDTVTWWPQTWSTEGTKLDWSSRGSRKCRPW